MNSYFGNKQTGGDETMECSKFLVRLTFGQRKNYDFDFSTGQFSLGCLFVIFSVISIISKTFSSLLKRIISMWPCLGNYGTAIAIRS